MATVPMKFMIEEALAKAIRIAAAEHGGKGQISAIANEALGDYLRKEFVRKELLRHAPHTEVRPTTTPGPRQKGRDR